MTTETIMTIDGAKYLVVHTTTIRTNGNRVVLADSEGNAKQYRNQTAADKALLKSGVTGKVFQSYLSRSFYVEVLG